MQPRITKPDRGEMLRYLGYSGQTLDSALTAQLDRCEAAVLAAARPLAVVRFFDLDEAGQLKNADFPLSGGDIRRHLTGCFQVAVMAVTLGTGVETLLLRTGVQNMADSLVMDAAASCTVENVCDNLEADLRSRVQAEGHYLTGRFSPGYGDLPLSAQAALLRAVNARSIGLGLTGTNLLVPRKSVTALLGVSKTPVSKKLSGCTICALRESCRFRKQGGYCGK